MAQIHIYYKLKDRLCMIAELLLQLTFSSLHLKTLFISLLICKYCRVPKLFRQETSPKLMVKLTDKQIEWAVKQVINKGESTGMVAAIYGVSRRRIQQLEK